MLLPAMTFEVLRMSARTATRTLTANTLVSRFSRRIRRPALEHLSVRAYAGTPSSSWSTPSSSAHSALAPTVLLNAPSQKDLEAEELDIELIPPEETEIKLSDRAAEKLRDIALKEHNADTALRIRVESGGCHGYQYKMELDKTRSADDYCFRHNKITPSNIIIDAVSMSLLKGSTIDYATELIGSSFRVLDNPQAKGSGCGCGVSWELKI